MKERLLGAAVLIAAAVLLIPAFLDGPRPPDTVSRELALPVPDAGAATASGGEANRTHTVEINSDRTASREFPAAAAPPVAVPPAREAAREPVAATSDPAPARRPATQSDAPSPPAIKKPQPLGSSWAVQVGSFSSESNARRLMEHLKGDGYPAFIVRNVVNGRVMFRVRVGPEADKPLAEALAERLRTDRQQTQLVRHP